MNIPLVILDSENNKILGDKIQEFYKSEQQKNNYFNYDLNSLEEFSFPPKLIEAIKLFLVPSSNENEFVPNLHQEITKSCNCLKSHCLRKYCECFKLGLICNINCLCWKCHNNTRNQALRNSAMEKVLKKESKFHFQSLFGLNAGYSKCCNCKKSNCSNKYCACKIEGRTCSSKCKCFNCQNLIHLNDN